MACNGAAAVTPKATRFQYITAPAAANLTTMGFVFQWQMDFDQVPTGAIIHQRINYTLIGYDANGAVVHTAIFKADDLLTACDGVAGHPPYFFDTQDMSGIQATLDAWNADDGVRSYSFVRTGDMRIAMPADVTIVDDITTGASHTYNPATDPSGMVFSVFEVDGAVVTLTGYNQAGTAIPPIGDRVRFTGTALYRAVWSDTVNTTVVWSGITGINRGPTYTRNGSIVWAQGMGGASGAVGIPIFPEKPTIIGNVIDITATSSGNVP
jgi:hypothetical protein